MTDEQSDFVWVTQHADELEEKYAGRFIAIAQQQVVAVGDSHEDALRRAKGVVEAGVPILIKRVDSGELYVFFIGSSISASSPRTKPETRIDS